MGVFSILMVLIVMRLVETVSRVRRGVGSRSWDMIIVRGFEEVKGV